MTAFPSDAPLEQVIRAFERLGFREVRRGNHISMLRESADGTNTPLTMPSHRRIKGSTLRTILTQARISREDFLNAFDAS
ncbi:MAG TPA: type II toxin-antitoxin system HicA family toxin [Candidatus Hydrogenedentes bacterium]|nr:type II toxin-antitoxin system HicA family toxin [Candidatus Hydrogenedentota bacterium]HOV72451.1 type II toxin-antitoxin system HicA family toxin [Candidatus Hydrogenedentota bacterium]HPC15385.1 type II toxin-antitoxin system HicA family toxin [Candidatus Hydrogenedentota bacterium]HRT19340.1 type II toxin-antitoxin system HicA family toxin [Candidatus Hydrogenedentota bacterium]HRT63420.1 type II toxin-antitoxin system HicA family toxin [Candidatus Hydrogenedentota bacterium]